MSDNHKKFKLDKLKILKIVLFLIGVILFSFGIYGVYSRFFTTKVASVVVPKPRLMTELLTEDLKKIEASKTISSQNINSVMRLARENNLKVKSLIEAQIQIYDQNNPVFLEIVKASGFYDFEPFDEYLKNLFLSTKKQDIKFASLIGLANNSTKESRKNFLIEVYKKNEKKSDKLKLILIECLFKFQPDEQTKLKYIEELKLYVKNPKNADLFYALQIMLNQVLPEKINLQSYVLEILKNPKYQDEIRIVSLTYLIQVEDKELKKNFKTIIQEIANAKSSDFLLHRMFDSIPRLCPTSRWEIIYWFISHKNFVRFREVLANVVVTLNEEEGEKLFIKALENNNTFKYNEKIFFKSSLEKLKVQRTNSKPLCR